MSGKSDVDADGRKWYVRMEAGGAIYGPVRTRGLLVWTMQGRVLPDDEVSEDQVHWRSAHELPELEMDMLIAHPNGSFIGPFHRDALKVLIQEGKIPPESVPFPKGELAERMKARQMMLFGEEEVPKAEEPTKSATRRKKGKKSVQERENAGSLPAGEEIDLRPQLAELQDLLKEARARQQEAEERLAEVEAERDRAVAAVEKGRAEVTLLQEQLQEHMRRVEEATRALDEQTELYAQLLRFSNERDVEYKRQLAQCVAHATEPEDFEER